MNDKNEMFQASVVGLEATRGEIENKSFRKKQPRKYRKKKIGSSTTHRCGKSFDGNAGRR